VLTFIALSMLTFAY